MNIAATLPIRHFTADEVEQMVKVGILGEDEPLELIDGVLETVSPQSADHAWLLDVIEAELRTAYGGSRLVRSQRPIDATDSSRPEPDIAVVVGPISRYRGRHPSGADVILLVEVALSSLERDRRKAGVYGRAGVPVLWILDVEGRRLEVHTHPGPDGYGVVTLLAEGQQVQLPGLDKVWKVADLLP